MSKKKTSTPRSPTKAAPPDDPIAREAQGVRHTLDDLEERVDLNRRLVLGSIDRLRKRLAAVAENLEQAMDPDPENVKTQALSALLASGELLAEAAALASVAELDDFLEHQRTYVEYLESDNGRRDDAYLKSLPERS